MGLGVAIGTGWLIGACTLTTADAVDLKDRSLRVKDVVQLDCVPEDARDSLGAIVLGKLPSESAEIRLSHTDIAVLAERRIPGLDLTVEEGLSEEVTLRAGRDIASTATPPCFAAAHPIAANQAISAGDLLPASCQGKDGRPPVHYDKANGVVRTAANLAQGDYLGRLSVPAQTYPDTGDELLLSVGLGPVRIERQVWAVQPAPNRGEMFVRDEAGVVFRVPLAAPKTKGESE
jgi:hypothetical protein